MTIPVSVRVDVIAEKFHIDCHMFCILLGQDPTLYPIARLNALVEETTCSGQLVRPH